MAAGGAARHRRSGGAVGRVVRRVSFVVLAVLACMLAGVVGFLTLTGTSAEAQTNSGGTAATGPRAPRLTALTVETGDTSTIVRLRLDRDVSYRFFGLHDPSLRLVIDLDRVEFAQGSSQGGRRDGAGLVQQLRWAQKSDSESRVVLDLAGPVRVLSHRIEGGLGTRTLRLELAAASLAEFRRSAPVVVRQAVAASADRPSPVRPGAAARRFTIVIDPGHGGRDPGAPGASGESFEKQMTLASGLVLRDILARNPRYRVVMTRDTDVFIPLERRIVVAREQRADLFISLHADAAPRPDIEGATVYTLSEEGGERSRRLLNNENWTIAPSNRSDDPRLNTILRDMTQRDTKNQSATFAEMLLDQLRPVGPLTGSSHRRAGFFVLLSPTVPAVLLEMGFMTDPDDEARLRNAGFRRQQMQATARAIDAYVAELDAIAGRAAAAAAAGEGQ
jgi:N-acetylmuramoyl-L-alanine amidase